MKAILLKKLKQLDLRGRHGVMIKCFFHFFQFFQKNDELADMKLLEA